MNSQATVVLDVGKTHSKVSLWSAAGALIDHRSRPNQLVEGPHYRELDRASVEAWLATSLSDFARQASIGTIVPVGHGAAAALVSGGRLYAGPMDYEDAGGASLRDAYDAQRDSFAATGSPPLPAGLNLGMQFHRQEALVAGAWPQDLQIVTWPQYWAWLLTGVASVEASSLGCHTDLWRPLERRYSDLAIARGWAARMAPLRRADEAIGVVSPEWRTRTGLSPNCQVLCGLHDSNAALVAARGHPELGTSEATVLSTGTWFVAMRSYAGGTTTPRLPDGRDCLLNVDVEGRPVPSARFMGGREAEMLCGQSLGISLAEEHDLASHVSGLMDAGCMALPGNVPGVGPFPDARGGWIGEPTDLAARRAAVSLYLALMADSVLDLLDSREVVLIEGRFADDVLFVRALASLRPDLAVFTSHSQDDAFYGGLRLVHPALTPSSPLKRIKPLPLDLANYRIRWRKHADQSLAGVRG